MLKKLVYCFLAVSVSLVACTRELEERMDQVESRVSKLESQVSELNNQVSVIQKLLSGKYFVQSVSDLADGSGYKLVLVDGNGNTVEKSVLHGEDGETPEMGIKLHSDGNYYWTLNGEWILVDGSRVRANGLDGADAPTTEFKVENGKWYVKVGEDGEWTYVGEAVTEVKGPIKSVDATSREDVVLFTLQDGTVLEIPKADAAVKLQIVLDETAFTGMKGGETQSTTYEVIAPAGVNYTLDSYEPEKWKVTISDPESNKGTVTIALPLGAGEGKVMLIANGDDGSCYVRVLHVAVGQQESEVIESVITVDALAGSVDLPSGATSVSIPSSASSWVSLKNNQLVLTENTTYDARTAVVTFKVGEQAYSYTLVQAQKDAIVLTASTASAVAAGEEIAFVLQANVVVSATADVDWIHVTPTTKGLVEKTFTIVVDANNLTTSRSGIVTFTSGELSQTVTITQAAASLTDLSTPGCYLSSSNMRVYTSGQDQFLQLYDGSKVDFILINGQEEEQLEMSGYTTSLEVGDKVSISLEWKQAASTVLDQSYSMKVLKDDGETVWIGDTAGRGFIIKK